MMPPTSIDGTDITGATIDGTDVQEITVDGQTVFTAGPTLLDNVVIQTSWIAVGGSDYRGMAFTPKVNTISRIEVVMADSGNGIVYPSIDLSNVDTDTILETRTGPINEGDTVVFDFNFVNGTEYGVAPETEDGTDNYAFNSGFSNGTSTVADVTNAIVYNTGGSITTEQFNDLAVQEFKFLG